jgi:hypothetical protein
MDTNERCYSDQGVFGERYLFPSHGGSVIVITRDRGMSGIPG